MDWASTDPHIQRYVQKTSTTGEETAPDVKEWRYWQSFCQRASNLIKEYSASWYMTLIDLLHFATALLQLVHPIFVGIVNALGLWFKKEVCKLTCSNSLSWLHIKTSPPLIPALIVLQSLNIEDIWSDWSTWVSIKPTCWCRAQQTWFQPRSLSSLA